MQKAAPAVAVSVEPAVKLLLEAVGGEEELALKMGAVGEGALVLRMGEAVEGGLALMTGEVAVRKPVRTMGVLGGEQAALEPMMEDVVREELAHRVAEEAGVVPLSI